jgi:hypothetical protein
MVGPRASPGVDTLARSKTGLATRDESRDGTGTDAAAKMRSTMSETACAVALALRCGGSHRRSPFWKSIEKSSGTPAKNAVSVSA